jgi:SPP1 family predicted phage head-tail adaptor
MITAGRLNKRVAFQRLSSTPDSFGQPVNTYSTYYTAFAEIDALRSQMLYDPSQFVAQSTYKVVIRYPWGINISPNDHIVWEGMTFNIQSIVNTGMRNIELQILAYVLDENDGTET